ncbi:MAG: DUF3370 domain-containing protein [Cyanosarcina radialis HA8281-LM2]|jgi:hypothetical protein|nr:DUF3370 domain-containing protein [Cyanosarcina radialis HA8281-LM2]
MSYILSLVYLVAQAIAPSPSSTPAPPQEIVQTYPVQALPGGLDRVPVFNSNSPEWVKKEGVLLSTLPPTGKTVPEAHLNFAFSGRFDLFAHHYTHTPKDLQTLYLGIIVHNPGKKGVTVEVLQGASYLMVDAPFIRKPTQSEDPNGEVYSGPGDRAVSNVIRGRRQADFPAKLVVPPGQSRLLLNHPIPVRNLEKPVNGRSTFMRLQSNGKVYVASLAMFAKKNSDGADRSPTLAEWQNLLKTGGLAGPRDKTPTPPGQTTGQFIYSRVAGVSEGSSWKAQFPQLNIPQPGQGISYPISTLKHGTLGTGQIQTAKMLVRYPDTAYEAHGNYGIEYNVNLPLYNPSDRTQTISLAIATPFKEDKLTQGGLRFRRPPLDFPFFRGTVRWRYPDDAGKPLTRYVHLWQRRGELVEPSVMLTIPPKSRRQVQLDLIYPPDSTPPQVLTLKTSE